MTLEQEPERTCMQAYGMCICVALHTNESGDLGVDDAAG